VSALAVSPITRDAAFAFIREHHRHLRRDKPGWLFGVCLRDEAGAVVAVAYLSRPASRHLQDGFTAEVSRCCTLGQPNACSMLYGALRRAASALEYKRVITYTRADEPGSSVRAAGFVCDRESEGGEWSRAERPRKTDDPTPKVRWIWRAA